MSKTFIVPLDKDGNQHSWMYNPEEYGKESWEFEDTLEYIGFSRGRSALNIQWKSKIHGLTYESGMSLLDEALKEGKIDSGKYIHGKFTFKKQGTAVLLKAIVLY